MGGGKRKKTYQLKKIKPTWGDTEERAETSIRSKSKRRNTGERRERERELAWDRGDGERFFSRVSVMDFRLPAARS